MKASVARVQGFQALLVCAVGARAASPTARRLYERRLISSGRRSLTHSAGPRAGRTLGGADATPMWSSIYRMSALCVMNAMMRIWQPHNGHSNGNTS